MNKRLLVIFIITFSIPAITTWLFAEKNSDNERIQAFCIDFNWSGKGYASLSLPNDFSDADPQEHIKWYKEHGVNTIQTFCVSHNGYAWYDSKIAPKVVGLKTNFLKELVELGHSEGMKVMGYFSPGTNVYWLENHPDEIYDNNTMFHIIYTKKYLDYLGSVIYEAVKESGIDGFMIDAIFTAPFYDGEKMKWAECEKQMYEELFNEPFIGVENITKEIEIEFKRKSVERCWDTIYNSAKKANPECVIWLTCHDLTAYQIAPDSKIFKQVDWLMNENSDGEYLQKVKSMVGDHTKLIQCITGWAEHDSEQLFNREDMKDVGFYGFAWPDSLTTLPYTLESAANDPRFKRNAENILKMKEEYNKVNK